MGVRTKHLLLITDIGRDIDDTLTILALAPFLRSGAASLAAVVTSGGASDKRAGLARGWLRLLGLPDAVVPVAAGRAVGGAVIYFPPGFPAPEAAALSNDPTAVILAAAERHKGDLYVLVIGPITPLADALRADTDGCLHAVAGLYIQGQAAADETMALRPLRSAFNLREDFESAEDAFAQLRDRVPIHLLGKHSAYAIKFEPSDFAEWDAALAALAATGPGETATATSSTARAVVPVSLSAMVMAMLEGYRAANPKRFYELYGVPPEYQGDAREYQGGKWFTSMSEVSMPYDVLAMLLVLEPAVHFAPEEAVAGQPHTLCGATEGVHNLRDVAATRTALVAAIGAAADLIAAGGLPSAA